MFQSNYLNQSMQDATELVTLYNRLKDDSMWIIVRRHVKDTKTRGEILATGLSETQAHINRDKLSRKHSDSYHIWAMPAKSYFTPYSI